MGWGDINSHIDVNMNIDIHIITNMNVEDYKRYYILGSETEFSKIKNKTNYEFTFL